MPILPLPQFEADLAEQDRETYERLKPPSSVVVRFGHMKMVGEFPYSGEAKPGCGSKMVVKTHRGTELGEMLTSTCPNSGCSKSVSRQEMLEYIENSGGRDYPFFSMQGRVLRIATAEDLNEQARLDGQRIQMSKQADAVAQRMKLNMKVVDAEPIIGGEKLTFHFTSEDRIDFRELVNELAAIHHTRIEMRQVGARDEARLTADYERCGQHCCCKQFLKVLKPVSMKSAKIQKATLDPLKISGRCGRLMCCLRYEDETYDELRARLPRKKSRVKTPEGWGTVMDGQILTQLVLVQLDSNLEQVAVPVEDLEDPATAGTPPPPPPPPPPGVFVPRSAGVTREVRAKKPGAPESAEAPLDDAPTPTSAPAAPQRDRRDRPERDRDRDRDRDRRGPDGSRGDRRDRPQQPPPVPQQRGPADGRGGPPAPRAPQPPRPPQPARPRSDKPMDDVDELLAGMETDFGDGRRSQPTPPRGRDDRGGGGRPRDRRDGPRPPHIPTPRPQDANAPQGASGGDGPMDDEADDGPDDGPIDGPQDPSNPDTRGGEGGGGDGGGGRRKRRRRRRRGGGGGGGGGGGPPSSPPA